MNNRLIFAACLTLLLGFSGCDRPGEDKSTLGTHTLIIVDTSGKKPMGGTLGTGQDDVAGTTIDFYDSANGRYKITLANEVLTINGVKYTLVKPKSEIRIVDDQVKINGVEAVPDAKS